MKTVLKKISFMALAVILILSSSCKKDDKKEELLMGSWIYTGITINPGLPNPNGGSPITDFFFQLTPCERDNFITLKTNGNYQVEEGATKCDESAPAIVESGKWTLNAEETVISVTPVNDTPYEFQVVELTKNNMKLNRTERINGVNYTMTMSFRPK
jgi:hypothetical protein